MAGGAGVSWQSPDIFKMSAAACLFWGLPVLHFQEPPGDKPRWILTWPWSLTWPLYEVQSGGSWTWDPHSAEIAGKVRCTLACVDRRTPHSRQAQGKNRTFGSFFPICSGGCWKRQGIHSLVVRISGSLLSVHSFCQSDRDGESGSAISFLPLLIYD